MLLCSERFVVALVSFGSLFFSPILIAQEPGAKRNESTAKGDAETSKAIQNHLDSLAASNQLSGAVVVAKDGVTIASKAAGMANKTTKAANDLQTKFNVGSLDKMFTAVAIAQLAQQGKLRFSDTIGRLLPAYPNKEVAEKVTVHQLLTHTSGIASFPVEQFRAERTKLTTVSAYFPLFVETSLSFSPGAKFEYSNSGYIVLGAIIEQLSGQDYYNYVRDHVFAPAGMTDSGFYEPGKKIPNLAIGYTKMGPDGKSTDEVRENTDRIEVRGGPAGGGYSTVGDLAKFATALRTFKLLDQEHSGLVTTGKVDAPGPIGRYAYGFGDKVFEGKRIVGHNGGWPGVAANFEMYPNSGYTAVILMNADPPAMMPIIMQLRKLIP